MKNNKSTTWINGYFERVKRVFNYGIEHFDNASELQNCIARMKAVLKSERKVIKNPAKLINKSDLQKLLRVSNAEEKAMWLLSLNCAYYKVDIATLPIDAIDFENRTVIYRRTKTGEHRAAIMWESTCEAIRGYQKEFPHKGRTLFISKQTGTQYNDDRVYKLFVGCKNRAKIESKLSHNHFRDSAETVCRIKGNIPDSIDAVMGHKDKKSSGNYVDPEAYPQIAEPACKAIYEFYFGEG